MKKVIHWFALSVITILILAIPYMIFAGPLPILFFIRGNGADAVSSATGLILDKPSGNYVVLLNTDKHKNTSDEWMEFFNGKSVMIMEDISCMVADGDSGGLEFAKSLQSRLPENQMRIRSENGIMMVSKAEYSGFDVIIMSQELADAYTASTVYGREDIEVITIVDEV